MAASTFGALALKDRHFVQQLRRGRNIQMNTADKVRRFMAEYQPQSVAA